MVKKMDNIKKNVKEYLKKIIKIFNKQEMRVLPGNVAFFFVLALIPILTLISVIVSRFNISLSSLINLMNDILPSEASSTITDVMSNKDFDTGIKTFNIIALFVASNGTYAIVNASNTLYKVNNSDVLKNRIKSIILLFILLALIVFLLLVPIFGGKILSLFVHVRFYKELIMIYNLMRWPISFFLIYINLKLIYTISPSKKINSKDTTNGSLFTTVIWTFATAIFSYYLDNFANYSAIYGNLSNIIIIMIWIYVISYVFVLGIAINALVYEEK